MIFVLISLFFCAVLFLAPALTADSLHNSAVIFFDSLLPSLFPFMITASFLTLSGAAEIFTLPLIFLRLFAARDTVSLWLSSFIGGYPSGAVCLCQMTEEKLVSQERAEKLLPCLINPGPAFLLLVVGKGVFGSVKAGLVLLLSQAISSFLLTALSDSSFKKTDSSHSRSFLPAERAFVTAVSKSAAAMLEIFAYILAFGFIADSLTAFLPFGRLIALPLEVTLGCRSSVNFPQAFSVTAFLIGFGGFSVCFQVLSIAAKSGMQPRYFWRKRFFAGALNALFAKAGAKAFLTEAALCYAEIYSQPIAVWSVNRLLGAFCICSMLLLTLQKLDFSSK